MTNNTKDLQETQASESSALFQETITAGQDKESISFLPELLKASGEYRYALTNDYMFRAALQTSPLALKSLCSSILHIPLEEIKSVEIVNPIELGETPTDKEYRLDMRVILNGEIKVNLEMQVIHYVDWDDRSLVYLCRDFDDLVAGQDYREIKPVVHIGILDHTLFPEHPSFHSEYKIMDTKTHRIYNDKLSMHVLCLNQIERASEEDIRWQTDRWARLFKARTWEGLRMVAEKDTGMTEMANSIYRMNEDYWVRKRCLDREEYLRDMERGRQSEEKVKELTKENKGLCLELVKTVQERDKVTKEKDEITKERDKVTKEKDEIAKERDEATKKNVELTDKVKQLEAEIEQLKGKK